MSSCQAICLLNIWKERYSVQLTEGMYNTQIPHPACLGGQYFFCAYMPLNSYGEGFGMVLVYSGKIQVWSYCLRRQNVYVKPKCWKSIWYKKCTFLKEIYLYYIYLYLVKLDWQKDLAKFWWPLRLGKAFSEILLMFLKKAQDALCAYIWFAFLLFSQNEKEVLCFKKCNCTLLISFITTYVLVWKRWFKKKKNCQCCFFDLVEKMWWIPIKSLLGPLQESSFSAINISAKWARLAEDRTCLGLWQERMWI